MSFCQIYGFTEAVGIFIALALITITYLKWSHGYWKRHNLGICQPPSLIFGNSPNIFKPAVVPLSSFFMDWYADMRAQKREHFGTYFYTSPIYVPVSLENVQNIMTKDFNYFVDRGSYYNEKDDPLSAHLFSIGGVRWKNLRAKLSPTFTSGKMKMMFQTLTACAVSLQDAIDERKNQPLDIKDILGCFTTDVIGSCAFGLECNSFTQRDSIFRFHGNKFFSPTKYRRMLLSFASGLPVLGNSLGIIRTEKDTTTFFMDLVRNTIEYREKNNERRNDFLQILIDLNKEEENDHNTNNGFTFNEIVAQCFIFFAAGFETSSSTMTFALFEIAQNPEIQERVRKEINSVLKKYNDEITYEAINDMKYMHQVLEETLRKYPPVPLLSRVCVKDYKVPDTDVIIKKGIKVIIPVIGIHYDKEYYPEPQKFDPERFTEENKRQRSKHCYLPFGEGPRLCIGMRFGYMQSKVGLTVLLRKYRFTLNEKTILPLRFNPRTLVLSAFGDIWLNVENNLGK